MINGGASPNKFLGAKTSFPRETAKQSQICQIYEAFELHGGRQSIGSGTKLFSPSVDGQRSGGHQLRLVQVWASYQLQMEL